jgi:hypothetical protein
MPLWQPTYWTERHSWKVLFTLAVIFGLAFSFNFNLFRTEFHPVLDYAADMLWADTIRDQGFLLVGHYSRFDFNHPGPFWLYWSTAWEYLLVATSLSRFQIWVISSLVINSLVLVCSGWALSQYLYGTYKTHVSIILFMVTLLVAGGQVFGLWMPLRLITTYIALMVTLLHLLRGNVRYLPALGLFGGMLLHGYVTTPLAIFPVASLCVGVGLWRVRHSLLVDYSSYKSIGCFIAICLLFIGPIVGDHLLADVSNLKRIFRAQDSITLMSKPAWLDMWGFYKQLVSNQTTSWFAYIVAVVALLALYVSRIKNIRDGIGAAALLFVISSCWLVIYYVTTPAPIYAFTAQYFVGGTVVLVSCIVCRCADVIWSAVGVANGIKTAVGLAIMVIALLGLERYVHENEIPALPDQRMSQAVPLFTQQLSQALPALVAIAHQDPGHWGLVAGLLLELRQRGIAACVARPDMAFLYTKKNICLESAAPDVYVVKRSDCREGCLATSGDWGILRACPTKARNL